MSNLALRLASAAVLIPLALILVLLGSPPLFSVVMVGLAIVSGLEWGNMTLAAALRSRRAVAAVLTGLAAGSIAFSGLWAPLPILTFSLLFPIAFLAFSSCGAELADSVRGAGLSVAGAAYVGSLLGVIALLFAGEHGRGWVLLLAAGAFMGDTTAYAAGRALGRRKLAPRLSPSKTWAGSIGGLLGTMGVVAAAKATVFPELEWIDALLLGLPLSVACQIGDLAESFVKRGCGVKDSGRIIPGHGGLLDRIDGFLFGAPVVYVFTFFR
ncbi:MAG: phosphatidate cytidylyltransferase [Deltaproteobacteria bacterium]|nr:phosphatidate cytidylyltransferase [Deltaproteobacteria bacterium]